MNEKQIVQALAVLGLRPGATQEECQIAFRVLAKKCHPDLYPAGSPEHAEAVNKQTEVNAAYELLKKVDLDSLPIVDIPIPKNIASTDSWETELQRGRDLEKTGNILEAADLYKRLAQQGFAKAQFRLGYVYFDSVLKDMKLAYEWWKRAADQGHPSAGFNLGLMYERGLHVPLDMTQAIHWYTEAARHGDKQAADRLRKLAGAPDPVASFISNASKSAAASAPPPTQIIGRQRSASEAEQAGRGFISRRK